MNSTGPWNVVLSTEGEKGILWSKEYTTDYLSKGYAKWHEDVKELEWNPRYVKNGKKYTSWKGNPSGTIWKHIEPQNLESGVELQFQIKTRKADEQSGVSYDDEWDNKEDVSNLRRVAGTGDFRIALAQSDMQGDMGKWHAYQVRCYPYLHREAVTHIGESDTSNNSYWYRDEPGPKNTFICDWSQMTHTFKKLKHKGELKFGMGPHSPYDEWVTVAIKLKKVKDMMHSSIKIHNNEIHLTPYKHLTSGFDNKFTKVDAYAISFNNMRPYYDLRIRDVPDTTEAIVKDMKHKCKCECK